MKFKTRKGKLEEKIKNELLKPDPSVNVIIEAAEKYESDNLKTIDKLKKKKKAYLNRINGALKQSINAHGPITKELMGSASKRLFGSLLELEEDKVYNWKSFAAGCITVLLIGIAFYFIL